MKAKVKNDCNLKVVTAFAGVEYVKYEYRPVPASAENEALRHPFLEIETAVAQEEPVTAVDYSELKVTELKELAAEVDIDGYQYMRKAELIEALR